MSVIVKHDNAHITRVVFIERVIEPSFRGLNVAILGAILEFLFYFSMLCHGSQFAVGVQSNLQLLSIASTVILPTVNLSLRERALILQLSRQDSSRTK